MPDSGTRSCRVFEATNVEPANLDSVPGRLNNHADRRWSSVASVPLRDVAIAFVGAAAAAAAF
jgi:hypothetical protein